MIGFLTLLRGEKQQGFKSFCFHLFLDYTDTMTHRDKDKIEYLLTRGVEKIFPSEDFVRSRLLSGEKLTLYMGIDPTGPALHLGHLIPLIKLSQFQDLGHKVILLIGDFTAQIGDPDKTQVRKQLTHKEVLENAKNYKKQASKILAFSGRNKAELRYNSKWLKKIAFPELIHLASQMTVQRMLDRDMFRRRMKEGSPIYIHEFMYPLMQGYDSVVLAVDGEVGGNDQTFNMLVGRDLQKKETKKKEKFIIPMKLLVDSQGNKMGKTTGNMLSLSDTAEEQFKKIMRWEDENILLAFELLTDEDLLTLKKRIQQNENPRDLKLLLAEKITTRLHGETSALKAKETWVQEVSLHKQPETFPEVKNDVDFITTLQKGTGESKSQLRRLIKEGAIRVNDEKVSQEDFLLNKNDLVQIGKKKWLKII